MNINLDEIQARIGAWAQTNFPSDARIGALRCTLGVAEEAGELAHSILKRDQGIRGGRAEHSDAAKDAVGDIVIYLCDLCAREGWSLEDIILKTSSAVLKRDWVKHPDDGAAE